MGEFGKMVVAGIYNIIRLALFGISKLKILFQKFFEEMKEAMRGDL